MEPATQTPPQPDQPVASRSGKIDDARLHPMVVLQRGEEVVATVKRHPFGIITLYIGGLIGIIVAAVLAFVIVPNFADQYNLENVKPLSDAALVAIAVILTIVLGLATVIYWQNEWIITTDSITQISQRGLFNRQVSQLSMDNLEDVTVDQAGIIPEMFNFGTLKVETAGERSKFQFVYCPRPNVYARYILEAHEKFLEDRRNVQNA